MGIKVVLMDLDGTVYRGNELIPGADSAIRSIRDCMELVFFTNNSGSTRKEIAGKLESMGITCTEDDVLSSGYMAAVYAKENRLEDVYVCGTDSLREEFRAQGIKMAEPSDARCTVVGFDPEFDYGKLAMGVRAAMRSERLIACNKERIFPCGDGMCPGSGAMVSSAEFCSGKDADLIVGKPNTLMLDLVTKRYSVDRSEILVVGDTYESDIVMADAYGARSVLIGDRQGRCMSLDSISELPDFIRKASD